MMDTRWFGAAPLAALAAAILLARLSGNDKAPFLVLAVLVLIGLLFLVSSGFVIFCASLRCLATPLAVGAAAALSYAGLVIVLARLGWLDSALWLGFR